MDCDDPRCPCHLPTLGDPLRPPETDEEPLVPEADRGWLPALLLLVFLCGFLAGRWM